MIHNRSIREACGDAAVWAACSVILTLAPLANAQPLNAEVQRLINNAKLGDNAKIGVYAIDSASKNVLVSIRAGETYTPASNQKLLTSGAALLVLGPDFQFSTELIRDGETLFIKGSGDPALADPDVLSTMEPKLTVDDVLDVLTKAVPKAGMDRVKEIVIDDRAFDRDYVHPSWPTKQLGDWYCAEVGGLNFHTNVLSVYPRPSPDGLGNRPTITIQPFAAWLSVENLAKTVGDGKNAVSLNRVNNQNQFRMRGEVRTPMTVAVETTVHENGLFFGQILADRLQKSGVPVGGEIDASKGPSPAVRLIGADEPYNAQRTVAKVTTPLSDVLRRCNRDSHNLYAEALIKAVGHQTTGESGSWTNGSAVIRMMISQKVSPDASAHTVIADGSGMSRNNKVAPSTLAGWLDMLARESPAIRDAFTDSLAVPGQGTLKERFQSSKLKNEVRGKSGYIKGVRTLSGYLIDPKTGRRISWSVMVNTPNDEFGAQSKRLHEDIVASLDRWLARQTPSVQPALGG